MRLWKVFRRGILLGLLLVPATFQGTAGDALSDSPDVRAAIRSATAGDYDFALKRFSDLLAEHPKNPLLHYYVGLCHFFRGDAREAVESFEQSIALKAEFPEAYYWAAQAYRSVKEPGKARECVRLGLEHFPANKKLLTLSYQGSQ